jgi:SAM-dependent methyltransferase
VSPCPVCGTINIRPAATSEEVRQEFELQREFILSRFHGKPVHEELKDLTDFMHDAAAPLAHCAGCGLLMRAEEQPRAAASYEEDPNDPGVMQQVYPRYLQAFRKKETAYRALLRPRADVIELGPHLGAFLQVAEEWDWRPTGFDVGADTSDFAKHNGLKVIRGTLEDSKLPSGSSDAVFVWNCFEQLPDPMETLRSIRRALKRHGLVIVRVPNQLFYRMFRGNRGFGRKALAYNNLLGFPYLFGYSLRTLDRLMARAGFENVQSVNSELITTPFADLPVAVEKEQRNVSRAVALWTRQTSQQLGALTGPWIEAVYRMMPAPVVPRPVRQIDQRFLPRAVA